MTRDSREYRQRPEEGLESSFLHAWFSSFSCKGWLEQSVSYCFSVCWGQSTCDEPLSKRVGDFPPNCQNLLLLGEGLYSERKQDARSERYHTSLAGSRDQSG